MSATKELDDLMASISDLDIEVLKSHYWYFVSEFAFLLLVQTQIE